MNKQISKSKKLVLFVILSLLIGVSACSIFVQANEPEFTFNLDTFKEAIQSSADDCWKYPAQNRKDSMCNKLTKLQQLIADNYFEEAYDKLLQDIKPKLTGLKTDENEQSWGNGVFEEAWVTCEDLREEFRLECNSILKEINPQSVYDDDKTPPEISIIYEGMQNVDDPGVWHIDIEDLESGLDIVIISVNGIEEVFDLNGEWFISYDILVPAIIGINIIVITATNNDKEFVGDQETSITEHSVTIFVDTTSPSIIIDYVGDSNTDNPGVWNVYVEDLGSGLDTVTILVNGDIIYDEQLGGVSSHSVNDIEVPAVADIHIITVKAKDTNQNEIEISQQITIVPGEVPGPGPIIIIG